MKYLEHQDVTLKMVIDAGLLKPGTIIYASSDNKITGILNDDGSITIEKNGITKNYPYPSGAARAIRGVSISGWIFWLVLEEGNFISLLEYKKKCLGLSVR